MTNHILHGGNTRDNNPNYNSFFKVMTDGITGQAKVHLMYFASEEEISER